MQFSTFPLLPFAFLFFFFCQLFINLVRMEVEFNNSRYWWARQRVTLATENCAGRKQAVLVGLCFCRNRGAGAASSFEDRTCSCLYNRKSEQNPTVSSTTALCYVCRHSEQSGVVFVSSSCSPCRWWSREGGERAQLGFFKVSFQMEMTWMWEDNLLWEESHVLSFLKQKRDPMKTMKCHRSHCSRLILTLHVLPLEGEVRLNPAP